MITELEKRIVRIKDLYLQGKLIVREDIKYGKQIVLNHLEEDKQVHFWGRNYSHVEFIRKYIYRKYSQLLTDKEIEKVWKDFIREILNKANKKTFSTKSLIKCLESQINSQISEFKVALPIHGLEVETVMNFGNCTFYPLNKFPFEKYINNKNIKKVKGYHKEQAELAILTMDICCSRKKKFPRIINKTETSLSILTFFSDELGNIPRGNAYIDVNGSIKQGYVSYYSFEGGFGQKLIGIGALSNLKITKEKYHDFINSVPGKKLNKIFTRQTLFDTEKRILKSLRWYRKASLAIENEVAFSLYNTALESLLTPTYAEAENSTGNGSVLQRQKSILLSRVEKLIETDDTFTRYSFAKYKVPIKELKRKKLELKTSLKWIRNEVVHQGYEVVSDDDLREIKRLVEGSLGALISHKKLPQNLDNI